MVFEDVIVLIISLLIAVAIVALFKLITKKWMEGWVWVFPVSIPLGYVLMFFTTSEDSILMMLKDSLIWAFVISMIVVNIKFLVSGTKSRYNNGKTFMADIKSEWKNMKPSFKKKKSENNEQMDNESENVNQEDKSDE